MTEIKNNVTENKGNVSEKVKENAKVTGNRLYIERVIKTVGDKEYSNYILKGQARGREVHADFAPKDKGGYEALDLVFGDETKAELLISEESMTDANGKTSKYAVYTVQNIDEFGIVYSCNIKPARDSDKAILGMILSRLAIENGEKI